MMKKFFIYLIRLYQKYISKDQSILYDSQRMTIPTPKFYVFYNGRKDTKDRVEFKLSDMYEGVGDLECTATMININKDHNKELLSKCQALYEYSAFVEKVYQKSENYDSAILQMVET